jgi:hypothetical protein
MMNEQTEPQTKKVTKIIFAWEDEKEEKWLEEMAAQGWKLETAAPYVYYFRKSAPEKVVIRMDYKNTLDKDYHEYLNLFRDAGWELVVTFANWHYFRISPQNNRTPEIYNSERAKAQKYRRLMITFVSLLPIFSIFLIRITDLSFGHGGSVIEWIYFISKLLMILLLILWGFVLFKLIRKIKKLESHSKE